MNPTDMPKIRSEKDHVKTKSFANARSAARWVAAHREVHVLSLTPEGGKQVLMYVEPEDQRASQVRRVLSSFKRNLSYTPKERQARNFPRLLLNEPGAVPLSRLANSLRNTAAFEGLGAAGTTALVEEILRAAGHRIVDEAEARERWGTLAKVVEVKTGRAQR